MKNSSIRYTKTLTILHLLFHKYLVSITQNKANISGIVTDSVDVYTINSISTYLLVIQQILLMIQEQISIRLPYQAVQRNLKPLRIKFLYQTVLLNLVVLPEQIPIKRLFRVLPLNLVVLPELISIKLLYPAVPLNLVMLQESISIKLLHQAVKLKLVVSW